MAIDSGIALLTNFKVLPILFFLLLKHRSLQSFQALVTIGSNLFVPSLSLTDNVSENHDNTVV